MSRLIALFKIPLARLLEGAWVAAASGMVICIGVQAGFS